MALDVHRVDAVVFRAGCRCQSPRSRGQAWRKPSPPPSTPSIDCLCSKSIRIFCSMRSTRFTRLSWMATTRALGVACWRCRHSFAAPSTAMRHAMCRCRTSSLRYAITSRSNSRASASVFISRNRSHRLFSIAACRRLSCNRSWRTASSTGSAVTHGPMTIWLSASLENEKLLLSVEDDGHSPPQNAAWSFGVGLNNVKQRLQLLYGDAAQLTAHCAALRRFHFTHALPTA